MRRALVLFGIQVDSRKQNQIGYTNLGTVIRAGRHFRSYCRLWLYEIQLIKYSSATTFRYRFLKVPPLARQCRDTRIVGYPLIFGQLDPLSCEEVLQPIASITRDGLGIVYNVPNTNR
ncbi:hypothetical protein EVAR_38438_1 [Eumeta japonica]|uniref:Uncharacterized protein n=1 Tax=Eumeta variegata TaxID=151549 RepID=A0A4C1WWW5_EUMVA|nr:hypothetical protein EVAR_38438_1 [Eumeta japonica]